MVTSVTENPQADVTLVAEKTKQSSILQNQNFSKEVSQALGQQPVQVASEPITGTAGNTFVNTNEGIFGTPLGREFGKESYLVDDHNGHRAYANIELSKENDGNVLRVRGISEAIKHEQNGEVPAQILMKEYIIVTGKDNTQTVYQNTGGVNGSVAVNSDGEVSGNAGGSYSHSNSATWAPVKNGDIRAINVEDKTSLTNDFSSAIHIPPDAAKVEYKLDATFVYDDGSRVSRSVAASADL